MLQNLLLTALRSLKKNSFFSILNILGLGIGLAVFLLIAQYVNVERSYENFVSDADNIYRVSLSHFAGNVRHHLMSILKLHAKLCVRERFDDIAFDLYCFFLRHSQFLLSG